MALTDKGYSEVYNITSSEQTILEATHAEGHLGYLALHPEDNPFVAGILKEIKDLQKEIDYLRTEISSNKDKTTFPGFGTSNSTALVGDTTTISTAQANAITANTAKTSMTLGTTGSTALAGDTRIPAFTADDTSVLNTTKSTAITFGNFTASVGGKGTIYSLPITVTETTVVTGGKPSTTTLTKTGAITLT